MLDFAVALGVLAIILYLMDISSSLKVLADAVRERKHGS